MRQCREKSNPSALIAKPQALPPHAPCFYLGQKFEVLRKTKKGSLGRPFLTTLGAACLLQRIVHVELNRVRGHTQARDLTHFQFNIGVNHRISKHAAFGQKAAAHVQAVQRLI